MHPNPAFRTETETQNLEFARQRGFGTLAVNADDGPLLSHVPFLVSEEGQFADLHLVRSNPIARLGEGPAMIAVTGPDSYISPDWYDMKDQVPTWNYVAVHLRGVLEPRPADEIEDFVTRLSDAFEARLAPKPVWTVSKMDRGGLERMLRMILPFRLHIERIDGTWKLNQNKPDDARMRAADHVAETGIGSEASALSDLMRRQ